MLRFLKLATVAVLALAASSSVSTAEARSHSHSHHTAKHHRDGHALDSTYARTLEHLFDSAQFADFLARNPQVARQMFEVAQEALPESQSQSQSEAESDSADFYAAAEAASPAAASCPMPLSKQAPSAQHALLAKVAAEYTKVVQYAKSVVAKSKAEAASADEAEFSEDGEEEEEDEEDSAEADDAEAETETKTPYTTNPIKKALNYHSRADVRAGGDGAENTNMIDAVDGKVMERFMTHVGDAIGASRAERTGVAKKVVNAFFIAAMPVTVPLAVVSLVGLTFDCVFFNHHDSCLP